MREGRQGKRKTISQVLFDTVGVIVNWVDIIGKPSTFPPDTHTHPSSDITDFNTAVDARIAATPISTLSDVTISAPSVGQVLKWNGSQWVNDTDATGGGSSPSPATTWVI